MKLNQYQYYTLKKLIDSKNSIICWQRQAGKTYMLMAYIEYFVNNNQDKEIIFISTAGKFSINVFNKINYELRSVVVKRRKDYIEFVNHNYITFVSQHQDLNYLFHNLKPSLVIFDDVEYVKIEKLLEITDYVNRNGCKSIFAMSDIAEILMKIINCNNNYFISHNANNQILRKIKLEKLKNGIQL